MAHALSIMYYYKCFHTVIHLILTTIHFTDKETKKNKDSVLVTFLSL